MKTKALGILVVILGIAEARIQSRQAANDKPAMEKTAMPVSDAGNSHPTDETSFDGEWWKISAPQEQFGFVNGYYDCYKNDANAPNTAKGSIVELQRAVSDFYETHPDQLRTSVPDVLRDLAVNYKSPGVRLSGGEVWSEPHGYYDGMWWKQAEPKEQIGYLEGYVSCYSHEVPQPRAQFSENPAQYQGLITRYYDHPKHSEDDKIADVLYRFRRKRTAR